MKRLSEPQKLTAGAGRVPLDESAFLQAVIEAIPGTFYVLDREGHFVRWNPAVVDLFEATDESMPRRSILDAVCGEDRPLASAMLKDALANGYAETEVRAARQTGEAGWRFLTARRVEIAGKCYLVGTGVDVTERRKLEHELERQARTDYLTGIPNRRHFLELAELELARAHRYGRPFSVLMLDLDLFKNVNDRYGHRAGDLALQKVVEVCRQILREVDVIGRLGGEEFGIMLPETDAEQAVQVADRVRQAIGAASVELPAGESVGITTSVGVATFNDSDGGFDSVLSRADRALYEAKRAGRDRVSTESDLGNA